MTEFLLLIRIMTADYSSQSQRVR